MQPWTSRETADIVYKDTTGSFTEKLIDDGYIDNDDGDWNEAKPTYYIEVKTTTGPCHTQFFMSGNQYQLVSALSIALNLISLPVSDDTYTPLRRLL